MKRAVRFFLAAVIFTGVISEVSANTRRDVFIQKRVRADNCRGNLSALYGCLKSYAAANNGMLPKENGAAGLVKLLNYGATVDNFRCQAAKRDKPKKVKDLDWKTVPYLYFGGGNLEKIIKKHPRQLLMIDRPDSRHCNALLADGTVVEINTSKFKRKISNCVDLVEVVGMMMGYSSDVLEPLRVKARMMDRNLK